MHFHMTNEMWWLVGRYGGGLVIAGVCWLTTQRWFPHRHTGYVAMNGYVHKCSHCGRLPDGAYRAGFHGIIGPDGYDADGYDADGYDADGRDRNGHNREYAYALRSAMDAGFAIGSDRSEHREVTS